MIWIAVFLLAVCVLSLWPVSLRIGFLIEENRWREVSLVFLRWRWVWSYKDRESRGIVVLRDELREASAEAAYSAERPRESERETMTRSAADAEELVRSEESVKDSAGDSWNKRRRAMATVILHPQTGARFRLLIGRLLRRFRRTFRARLERLRIHAGWGDPAATGRFFGAFEAWRALWQGRNWTFEPIWHGPLRVAEISGELVIQWRFFTLVLYMALSALDGLMLFFYGWRVYRRCVKGLIPASELGSWRSWIVNYIFPRTAAGDQGYAQKEDMGNATV